jgi:hypothetical protein
MRQANDLAYGFAKHTDPAYWTQGVGYAGDPPYYWKRLLGWQAGAADRALFGLYAVPPSPWHVPVDPPLPNPPEPTASEEAAGLLRMVLARLDNIDAQLTALVDKPAPVVTFPGFPNYTGTVQLFGTRTITLTPTT